MADKKKKQAGRRAYLNDFHRDLTGAYIYDGSHFHFAGDGWKQVLLRLWALGLVLVVLVLAGGFSGETMSHCVFQILPYLVEVGAVGSVVWALVRAAAGLFLMERVELLISVPKCLENFFDSANCECYNSFNRKNL